MFIANASWLQIPDAGHRHTIVMTTTGLVVAQAVGCISAIALYQPASHAQLRREPTSTTLREVHKRGSAKTRRLVRPAREHPHNRGRERPDAVAKTAARNCQSAK